MNWNIENFKKDSVLCNEDKVDFCGLACTAINRNASSVHFISDLLMKAKAGDVVYVLAREVARGEVVGLSACPEMSAKDLSSFLYALYTKVKNDGMEEFLTHFGYAFYVGDLMRMEGWADSNAQLLQSLSTALNSSGRELYLPDFKSEVQPQAALEIRSRRKRKV